MRATVKRVAKKRDDRNFIEFKDVSLQEFLGLSDAENEVVELKYRLAKALQTERKAEGITEKQLAARMGTHQPAVNRMLNEAGKVSLDTLVIGLLAVGKDRKEIGRLIAAPGISPISAVVAAGKAVKKR